MRSNNKRLNAAYRYSDLLGSVGAAAVNQAALSTTSGAVSVLAGTGTTNLVLAGGAYGFYPQINSATTDTGQAATIFSSGGVPTSSTTSISLTAGPNYALSASQRYVQASPPYDLGDGEVPLFIFAKINSLGNVLASYVAPEAPWHYNGPTDIRAERYSSDRRGYRKVKQFFAEHGNIQSARQSGMTRDQIAQAIADSSMVEIELTQDIKNADMPLIPHPFGTLGAGESVVLIDPVSRFVDRASRLHEGGDSICDLLHSGEIIIGNADLPRNKPPGVMTCSGRLKLT